MWSIDVSSYHISLGNATRGTHTHPTTLSGGKLMKLKIWGNKSLRLDYTDRHSSLLINVIRYVGSQNETHCSGQWLIQSLLMKKPLSYSWERRREGSATRQSVFRCYSRSAIYAVSLVRCSTDSMRIPYLAWSEFVRPAQWTMMRFHLDFTKST